MRLLDYEVEIGLVIGREMPVGTEITEDNLADYVAGLVVTNDVSARDVQLPKTQFYEAKSYPTLHPGRARRWCCWTPTSSSGSATCGCGCGSTAQLRQDARVDGDMIYPPVQALRGADPVPAARPRRPAAHRHPGRHRAVRTGQAGRDAHAAPAARAQVADLPPAARRNNPQATCRTATSSRPPWAPTTARSTSAASAPVVR